MAASLTFFNNYREAIARAVDLSSPPTINVTLHTSTFVPDAEADVVYADVSNELSTANGYTNGGQALASVTWTQSTTVAILDAADVVWTASGGSITARYAVVRLVGTFNSQVDPLMCYILLDTTPADVTATDGNTLTLQWSANGIHRIV
jgi:hypothetical protein